MNTQRLSTDNLWVATRAREGAKRHASMNVQNPINDTHMHTYTHTQIHTYKQTEKQAYTNKYTHAHTQTDTHAHTERERESTHRERDTDRDSDSDRIGITNQLPADTVVVPITIVPKSNANTDEDNFTTVQVRVGHKPDTSFLRSPCLHTPTLPLPKNPNLDYLTLTLTLTLTLPYPCPKTLTLTITIT